MRGSSSATAARTARAPRAGSRIICANTSPRCRSSGTWRPSSPARISSTASSARSRSCKVLIAVIGPRWATVTDEAGQRRLDNAGDYTRLEIATALKRSDVRVIPVLVEGAIMPGPEALPADLQALARRNAIELSDKRWDYDVSQLVATLRNILGLPDPRPRRIPVPGPTLPRGASG